jgi:hypothetical protein
LDLHTNNDDQDTESLLLEHIHDNRTRSRCSGP